MSTAVVPLDLRLRLLPARIGSPLDAIDRLGGPCQPFLLGEVEGTGGEVDATDTDTDGDAHADADADVDTDADTDTGG